MNKIVTGPIQSGKTTRLTAWVKCHQGCCGLLSPVINNRRYIYSIDADEYRCLEAEKDHASDQKIISIGRYNFLESTFAWARKQLAIAAKRNCKWLIIDEIGPLELDGRGLEPKVGEIVNTALQSEKNNLILVVRDSLIEKVVNFYHLKGKYDISEKIVI